MKRCRFCHETLTRSFVNLGMSPLSNAFLKPTELHQREPFYPLNAYVCGKCFLVQLEDFETPEEIFSDYAYFSSYSEAWLMHAQAYTNKMVERFQFDQSSQIIEIASNDGYLLQYFKKKKTPILGIEPAANVAKVAEERGIPTLVRFFGIQAAKELVMGGTQADLLLGNNVLAHVPDLNDFVAGLKILLRADGIITMEFPHLLQLIKGIQFDTVYHEHFSYFSFTTVEKIFRKHGLVLFDVDELPTHGGSLRIYACHLEDKTKKKSAQVDELKGHEIQAGLSSLETYSLFEERVRRVKRNLLSFLIKAKDEGKTIVGYGAPAKGNTLLNYCGIRTDFIDYTVDRSPHKQGCFLPGTHIPIYHPDKIKQTQPDYLLILPWNLKDEIVEQMECIKEWGGKFVIPIPKVQVIA